MSLNLKPILSAQTDNQKLDTINYNFDQIVANGGGPSGAQGATGPQGLDGLTGPQGNQGVIGPQGNQGPQGAAAANYWKINANINASNKTLVPIHGNEINPPTVMFGIDKLDPLYDTVFDETSVLINRKAIYGYNLLLTDDSVTTSDNNKIGFKLFQDGTTTKFEMGFANTSNANPTQWQFFADGFEFSDGTNNFVEILNSGFNVNVNSAFSQATTFQNTVKINSGSPADGKILVATDIQGTTTWKSVNEIGGVVPVGTIVPILTSIFDDTNNFYKDAETWSGGSGQVLKVRHGRGKGDYKGWYLCNGKNWTNGQGSSIQVPDLSSFDYTIDAVSGTGQGAASVTNSKYAIVGGANVEFTADYTTGYAFDDTITNTTQTIYPTGALNSTPYDLVHLVFVVYLGEDGWYWQDSGVAGVTNSFLALRSKTASSLDSSVNYTISGSGTFTTSAAPGASGVTITYTLTPSSGYQFNNTTNVALRTQNVPWTNAQGGWGAYDASVTQTSASINQSGQLVLTLTDSSFPTTNNLYTWLYLIGDAVQNVTGTGISVKRSLSGFQGSSSSAWTDQTVYIPSNSNFNTTTNLYSNSNLTSGASSGWYAWNSGSGWSYRYYNNGTFSSMYNMSGVTNAPGSWYNVSYDQLITSAGIGSYNLTAQYNACNSTVTPDMNAVYFWSTVSSLSTMSTSSTARVVASGAAQGSDAPINWCTDGTYGSGYVSLNPCFKSWSFVISNGLLTRMSVSCASSDYSYDVIDGGGDCSISYGYGGGGSGGSGGSSY
jgi:hypothetical protein